MYTKSTFVKNEKSRHKAIFYFGGQFSRLTQILQNFFRKFFQQTFQEIFPCAILFFVLKSQKIFGVDFVEKLIKKKLSFAEIEFEIKFVGEDILIIIRGGDKPHIGSCVLSVPRKSLADDKKNSCTSSVLNLAGHKDEKICRLVAENFCKKFNTTVVCTGGFHVDNLTAEKIQEVVDACNF